MQVKATVRPEMSVPKSVIDMLMQAAEQMNASATELTKQMLIGEECLDYLENAQRREQMRDQAAFQIPRSKLPESNPEQKRRKTVSYSKQQQKQYSDRRIFNSDHNSTAKSFRLAILR